MRKWRDLKGWQRGSTIGFAVVGIIHILLVAFVLLSGGIKGEGWLGFFLMELPLVWVNHIVNLMLNVEIFPKSNDIFFWIWVFIFGTITWGVVGAVPGFLIGLISDIFRGRGLRRGR